MSGRVRLSLIIYGQPFPMSSHSGRSVGDPRGGAASRQRVADRAARQSASEGNALNQSRHWLLVPHTMDMDSLGEAEAFGLDAAPWMAPAPWPIPNDDLAVMSKDDESWLVACMDWPRDRWLGYVLGYRLAAEVLVTHVAETGHHQDTLVYPFLHCWRHYVELQLKVLITLLQTWHRSPGTLPKTHRIDTLWNCTKELLLRDNLDGEDQEAVQNVEVVLQQLHGFDPTSEHARYPVKKDGSDTLTVLPRVHLRRFQEAMERVAHFLDACDTKLREDIKDRAEMEAELSTLYPD